MDDGKDGCRLFISCCSCSFSVDTCDRQTGTRHDPGPHGTGHKLKKVKKKGEASAAFTVLWKNNCEIWIAALCSSMKIIRVLPLDCLFFGRHGFLGLSCRNKLALGRLLGEVVSGWIQNHVVIITGEDGIPWGCVFCGSLPPSDYTLCQVSDSKRRPGTDTKGRTVFCCCPDILNCSSYRQFFFLFIFYFEYCGRAGIHPPVI